MNTTAVILPFDLFGSGGAASGARLLADALRELLADNKREQMPTRARAYAGKLRIHEFEFASLADYDDWRRQARQTARRILDDGDFLIWIAGNHLGALPVYDELAGSKETVVVQLDAHLDVYNLSDCAAELSHGNFLLHVEGKLPAIINLGAREQLLTPEHVKKHFRAVFPASELAIDPEPALKSVRQACKKAERVFVDVDVDVFDPAFFPAVAQPVPFGLAPAFLLRVLQAARAGSLRGLLLSEFDPARDERDRSLETLMWLLEHLLLELYER